MKKMFNKVDAWFSGLAFKWQVAIAMGCMFTLMAIIISFAGA